MDIPHSDIQGFKCQMIEGARMTLQRHAVDLVFISTHSNELHHSTILSLREFGYRIEAEADFGDQTTSFDGFIYATSPLISPTFDDFKPMSRRDIVFASPQQLCDYTSRCLNCQVI